MAIPTATVQSWIDATPDGGVVKLPPGLIITAPLVIQNRANLTVRGLGTHSYIQYDGPAGQEAIRVVDSTQCAIENMYVVAGAGSVAGTACVRGYNTGGGTHSCNFNTVRRCRFAFAEFGLYLGNGSSFQVSEWIVKDNQFENPKGWHLDSGNGQNHQSGENEFTGNSTYGLYVAGGSVHDRGSQFLGVTGDAITLVNRQGVCLFDSTWTEQCTGHSLHVTGPSNGVGYAIRCPGAVFQDGKAIAGDPYGTGTRKVAVLHLQGDTLDLRGATIGGYGGVNPATGYVVAGGTRPTRVLLDGATLMTDGGEEGVFATNQTLVKLGSYRLIDDTNNGVYSDVGLSRPPTAHGRPNDLSGANGTAVPTVPNLGVSGDNWTVPTPGGTRTAPTLQTANGRRVLRFNGTTDALWRAGNHLPSYFALIHCSVAALNDYGPILFSGGTNGSFRLCSRLPTTGQWGYFALNSTEPSGGSVLTPDVPVMLGLQWNGTNGTLYLNGEQVGTTGTIAPLGAGNLGADNGLYLATEPTGWSRNQAMDVYEWAFWNGVLTPSQRADAVREFLPLIDRGVVTATALTAFVLDTPAHNAAVQTTSGSAVTATLAATAVPGTLVVVTQADVGQVTFTPASGGSLRNRQSHTKTAGRWATVSLLVRENVGGSAAEWVLAGDTAS
jgi:hypothetical protein